MLTLNTLYSILRYPTDEYPFVELVREAIGEYYLTGLNDVYPKAVRETDQQTKWHNRFYRNKDLFLPTYRKFIHEFIARQISEQFYYQAVPTFRVHLPANLAVGEYHCDRDYGHPNGEINFWVPLTRAFSTNTVQLWGETARSINSVVGDIVVFDAVNTKHGNEINLEGWSRVSFDFRIIPVRLYEESDARTINTNARFAPGEYYEFDWAPGLG